MSYALKPLVFEHTTFDVIDRDGQPWLNSQQISRALGYEDDSSIGRIYLRNADEFTPSMTETVNLTVSGNLQSSTRIFSARGAYLLGMFARTEPAKRFRRWVLDVLDERDAAARAVLPPAQPAYMAEPWFLVLRRMAELMTRAALSRAVGIHRRTLQQVLNGTGRYGRGERGLDLIAERVARAFLMQVPRMAWQPTQPSLFA